MAMQAYDVVVIGGGVVGAACARAASLRRLSVAVFEPGPEPGAASPASAGMLAAQIEPGPDDSFSLAVRSGRLPRRTVRAGGRGARPARSGARLPRGRAAARRDARDGAGPRHHH